MSNNVNVTVTRVKRLTNSAEGNPRYSIVTEGERYVTQTNGSVGYTIDNLFQVDEDIRVPATLTLTNGGKVIDVVLR